MLSFSGQAGVDFPVLASVPETGFDCGAQQFPGIYGDTGADCQVSVLVGKLILFLPQDITWNDFIRNGSKDIDVLIISI